jgi:hypothetical protein
VVLTSNVKQLKPIFLAAKDLSTEDGVNFEEFKVIICGKTITDLAERNQYRVYGNEKKQCQNSSLWFS